MPPGRPAAAADKVLMQGLICIVLLCMAVQIIALPAQRTLGRAHLHLDARGAGDERDVPHVPHALDARGIASQHGHNHDQGHGHAALFRHRHDADQRAVVYLAEDDHRATAGLGAAPAPAAHDLDGLMPLWQPRRDGEVPTRWRVTLAPHFQSHVTAPPRRPPKG